MKPQKVRVDFRKNRTERTRIGDWTRQFEEHGFEEESEVAVERIGGKSELSRKRTVVGERADAHDDFDVLPDVDTESLLAGRVLRVHGASSVVQTEDGRQFQCVTRRILKTLSTEQRQPVVAGDRVLIRPAQNNEGMIERVEPRSGTIARTSKQRKHVIVANVDQVLIIASADQPALKPNLIDRMILTAEQSGVRPVICVNKIDLVDPAALQPLAGVYAQMGYKVLLLSAETGFGIDHLRRLLTNQSSVVAGQSGVGKSSLLNAVDPQIQLRVAEIGNAQKGKHTTTTAEFIQLSFGGYVVDTPGMRQFMLWDIIPEEVFGLFRDLRPYENRCHFPNCTHSHEEDCAVKIAVGEGRLDLRRYESYLTIRFGQ
ncbi:MAG: ribosome small subunit-dependent GTPase A [Planctomycetaceae bacterium]|jgi:ribosome biogenesis GTPase|nr:ribosome small subunit-dependent GTPase A [Planctomycetaceae bacterium]